MTTAITTKPHRSTEADLPALADSPPTPPMPPAPPASTPSRRSWTTAPDNVSCNISGSFVREDARAIVLSFDGPDPLGGNPNILREAIGKVRRELDAIDREAISRAATALDTSKLTTAQERVRDLEAKIARNNASFDAWLSQKKLLELDNPLSADKLAEAEAALARLGAESDQLEAELPHAKEEASAQRNRLTREAQAAGVRIVAEKMETLRRERREVLDAIVRTIGPQLDQLLRIELLLSSRKHVNVESEASAWGLASLQEIQK